MCKTGANTLNTNGTGIDRREVLEPQIGHERCVSDAALIMKRDFDLVPSRTNRLRSEVTLESKGGGMSIGMEFPQLPYLTRSACKTLMRLRSRGDGAPRSAQCPERAR